MLERVLHLVASSIEATGMAVMHIGNVGARFRFARRGIAALAVLPCFRPAERIATVASSSGLSFELLGAARAVSTVAGKPGSGGLGRLALVIFIRTLRSISFGIEIKGRWPWRQLEVEQQIGVGTGGCEPPGAAGLDYAEA